MNHEMMQLYWAKLLNRWVWRCSCSTTERAETQDAAMRAFGEHQRDAGALETKT